MLPSYRGGIILKFQECTKARVVPVLDHGADFFFKKWTNSSSARRLLQRWPKLCVCHFVCTLPCLLWFHRTRNCNISCTWAGFPQPDVTQKSFWGRQQAGRAWLPWKLKEKVIFCIKSLAYLYFWFHCVTAPALALGKGSWLMPALSKLTPS